MRLRARRNLDFAVSRRYILGSSESELEQELEGAMAREQSMAAGGIVLRREQPPLVAVVRLRKRDEWVLPKGKLDDGETPRDAAKREVLEETGHNVTVHEFLGTLVVDTGTRAKVVHYWRMEASAAPTRPLMDDVRAVDWLPLDDAVARLSRSHEKTFLENVGPYALAGLIRRTKAKPAAEEQAAPAKMTARSPAAARLAASKISAAKPAAARKRRSVSEPAEPAIAAATVPAPAEAVPVEISPVESLPIANPPANEAALPVAAETAVDDTTAPEAEIAADAAVPPADIVPEPPLPAVDDGEILEAKIAEAEIVEHDMTVVAPLTQEQPEGPAAISDVERVQAVAVEIKSMVSQAAARESAAATALADELDPEAGATDAPPEPASSDPVAAKTRESASQPADDAEPQRRSLAQKVRGWFGRAA
jgi:8-oxo-dGTP diphosphatase